MTDRGSINGLRSIGCVSFLNARPLIDGLDNRDDLRVVFDVPSRLLDDLLADRVDVALCPVVDYQMAPHPLSIVPVGGIGCDGATLTVRLYSRSPVRQIRTVHADTDSHTSIVLMRLLLNDLFDIQPQVVELSADDAAPQAMLLIGDKVVTAAPDEAEYAYQLDLGRAWKQLTDLPFVFAVWTARRGADLADLPALLDAQRQANAARIDAIAERGAAAAGWPIPLARQYLGELLRYGVGPRELQAMQRFWHRAHELNLLPRHRPLNLIGDPLDSQSRWTSGSGVA